MNDLAVPLRAGVDPITVEVIGSALATITEEMGEALIRASYSTNIKERRDCSTALFDIHGNTLCQAEHIPMHLGSFIGLIPHILKRPPMEQMRPGDVFCGNVMRRRWSIEYDRDGGAVRKSLYRWHDDRMRTPR